MIRKYKTFSGLRKWKTSITVPLEVSDDEKYMDHLKKELKERCVKEYIENASDAFEYRMMPDKITGTVELTIEMDDLFELKNNNKKLRGEITELLDMYNILKVKYDRK